jgi:hypothetical protein
MLCNTRVLTQDELVRKCQQAQRKIEEERVVEAQKGTDDGY